MTLWGERERILLFQNKVSSGRRTVQCPQTKAVATAIVQWQFHVKTYKCDTV